MVEQEVNQEKKQRAPENTIFVGQKPTMAYVLAVITQFSEDAKEVHIKARGKSISRAVDVAEVVRRKFLQTVNTTVNISTEEIQGERGKLNVSVIDIKLTK
ncbi:MAG: DNA-binding protein Alba [Candidatus Aenigmarchaeota archaeon]|nr:DNA-binding protein Alba [Candidatus Aenigmarchaeota archaeon]